MPSPDSIKRPLKPQGVHLQRQDAGALAALLERLELGKAVAVTPASGAGAIVALMADAAKAWCPNHGTLALATHCQQASLDARSQLEREVLIAMLAAPQALHYVSPVALASTVRVRANTAEGARQTALAFKTAAAERPAAFWREDEDFGFVLKDGVTLIDALVAATQPEATGRLYDFSCYRATEYVMLLALAKELVLHHPGKYARLETRCRSQVIRSRQFHEVFLTEYGSHDSPLPTTYYVPGDRVWFRNPDPASSDASGYEGSWVIYLGGGLFSNFWKRDEPYTLHAKCLEVFHWRDGLYVDREGEHRIDEVVVDIQCEKTRRDPARHQAILHDMLGLRDAAGVYVTNGCVDRSREFVRSACADHCDIVLPPLETRPAIST